MVRAEGMRMNRGLQTLSYLVRAARRDDTGALTELCLQSKQSNGYDDAFMAACREELTVTPGSLRDAMYWVVEPEGQPGVCCGCAALGLDSPTDGHSADTGEVHSFFVAPAYQGTGIGRLMWNNLLAQACRLGLRRLHLDADPHAVPFYQAMGCAVVGQSVSGSLPGRVLPLMSLEISSLSPPRK